MIQFLRLSYSALPLTHVAQADEQATDLAASGSLLVLSLAQSNQQPGRSVLVLACGSLPSEPKRMSIQVTATRSNLASGFPEWLTNVETFLYSIHGGQEMPPRVACCGLCPPGSLATVELLGQRELFDFLRQVCQCSKNLWGQIWTIGNRSDQFHSLINFIANPMDLHLEDQRSERRGLKLLDLVDKLLSFSQVLLIARLAMLKQAVCELSKIKRPAVESFHVPEFLVRRFNSRYFSRAFGQSPIAS